MTTKAATAPDKPHVRPCGQVFERHKIGSIVFRWFPKDWVDENGGLEGFAERDSRQGATPVAGAGAALSLEPKELPVPAETNRVGFAYLKLATPTMPPTSASASAPATTPTSASPAPATTPPISGTDGGGLAVTGVNAAAIAGAGGGLLLAGVITFLLTRRRNKFTA